MVRHPSPTAASRASRGSRVMSKARWRVTSSPPAAAVRRAMTVSSRAPLEALETAVSLGCRTILTSGQAGDALTGAETLRAVLARAGDRIEIMAGCGVRKENIREIHRRTGVLTFHTTGRRGPVDSGMVYRKAAVSMGLPSLSEYELWRTDEEEFRACAGIVHSLGGGL